MRDVESASNRQDIVSLARKSHLDSFLRTQKVITQGLF